MNLFVSCAAALLPSTVAVAVANKIIEITGAPCGLGNGTEPDGTYKATVWYPTDDSKKYPVLSFAHGATVSSPRLGYSGTISGVAEAGYIVVALNGCAIAGAEWKAQVSSLVYMITEEQTLKNIIDYSASTGVFGHSMGGQSTICSASDANSVKAAKIVAGVSMHPGVQLGPNKPLVPMLYFAGQLDFIVPSALVKSKYEHCPHNVDRGYAVFSGFTHFNPMGPGKNKEIEWTVAMMDCYVKKDTTGCTKVFGDGQDSMCNARQTSHCETKRAGDSQSSSELVVV